MSIHRNVLFMALTLPVAGILPTHRLNAAHPPAVRAFAGTLGAPGPQNPGKSDPFAKLRADWAAALHDKQLDRLVMFYAPDAVFHNDGERFTGRPAIRELSKKAMDTFTSNITLHSVATATAQSGDLAYDSGDFQETLVSNSDGSKSEARGTYLMVLKRQRDGGWLIQEHIWTEAPPEKH